MREYDVALENILYRNFNTTQSQKDIADVLKQLNFAYYGESDEELQHSFEEFHTRSFDRKT